MPPSIPIPLHRKIYKTGQTRGADDDQIFQNRVGRNSTVLIPYAIWEKAYCFPDGEDSFENGFIALVKPEFYFETKDSEKQLATVDLSLGKNALLFYETREQWNTYNPEKYKLKPAQQRTDPLGGTYIARVPATTAQKKGEKINRAYNSTAMKGAGIRLYEYASTACIQNSRVQLEAIYWLCEDAINSAVEFGMPEKDAIARQKFSLDEAKKSGLLDFTKLLAARAVDKNHHAVCPLCLDNVSAKGFYSRMAQAEGREVAALTITEVNLFHITELKYSSYNHRPYNLASGHHHCNVVTKDAGIGPTLEWMNSVIKRNSEQSLVIQKEVLKGQS